MMGFQVFTGIEGAGVKMPQGRVSISANGHARFNADDLADARITDRVTVLVDADARHIAIRSPKSREPSRTVTCPSKKTGQRYAMISLGGPLEAIGVKPDDVVGRRAIVIDDGLIVIAFGGK